MRLCFLYLSIVLVVTSVLSVAVQSDFGVKVSGRHTQVSYGDPLFNSSKTEMQPSVSKAYSSFNGVKSSQFWASLLHAWDAAWRALEKTLSTEVKKQALNFFQQLRAGKSLQDLFSALTSGMNSYLDENLPKNLKAQIWEALYLIGYALVQSLLAL